MFLHPNMRIIGFDRSRADSETRTADSETNTHGGGNFDIIGPLWTFQVNVKFHGDGNLDII